MNLFRFLAGGAAALLIASGAIAQSTTYGFSNITNNNAADAATAGQYSLEVSTISLATGQPLASGEVAFIFRNDGPADSAITRIYFEENDLIDNPEVHNLNGWSNFEIGGVPPDPPGGGGLNPPFATSHLFTSHGEPSVNGINPGEALEIVFEMEPGVTYLDLIAAIDQGLTDPGADQSLRIAMHVQAFNGGGSESFIVTVPLPAPVWMGLAGLCGIAVLRRRMTR